MTLVDTSVWIQHLRHGNGRLAAMLDEGEVLCHPFVIGELACGILRNRDELLELLAALPAAPQGPGRGANLATGLRVGEVDATQSLQPPRNSSNVRETHPPTGAQYYDFTTLEGLIAGTKDLDWKVRWDAVNTLGEMKDPGGIEALTSLH